MKFVLIGGKDNNTKYNGIEKRIIKDKKNLLFIPYAMKDISKAINNFKLLMNDLDLNITNMTYDNINQFDELISKNDIIYVYGGVCDNLVNIFKKYNLDKILLKHLDSNKIYIGSSAGAMLPTVTSLGDKDMYSDNYHNYNYKMVDCLGILNISICPHYQNEDLIIYNDYVKNLKMSSFGIEEDTAVVIENNKFYCIKDNKTHSAYYFKSNKMISLKENIEYEEDCGFRP